MPALLVLLHYDGNNRQDRDRKQGRGESQGVRYSSLVGMGDGGVGSGCRHSPDDVMFEFLFFLLKKQMHVRMAS